METQLLDFGLRMECIGDTGRNLVAVKAFQAGETVLQNEPLFSWDNASMEDYIIKYIESSPEIQEQVMGMEYHEDESADSRYSDLHRIAESLAERISGNYAISPAMVYKLLQIKRTNAHAYSSSGRQSRGALFRLASKCNHSCAPNVMYSSLDGLMQFTALSNIEIGDVIYASYLTDLLVTPYADRQKKLMDTKDFQCRCRRCLSTDDCCGLRCLTSTKTRSLGIKCQKGVAYRRNSDAIWVCSTCNAESTDDDMCLALSAVQVGLVEKFAELERKFIAATDPMSPNDFTNVIEEVCRIGFTKRHYLVLKTQRLYVKWCQGQSVELTANGLQADAQCTSPWGELCSAMGFLMTAVNESLSLIQQLECIGSSCSTG